jgi:hypothetical protein
VPRMVMGEEAVVSSPQPWTIGMPCDEFENGVG